MTYYGGRELAASFRTVRKNTIQIAEDIPEEKYSSRAAPDARSIGQTLVHIAYGTSFAHHIHANRISDIMKVNFTELMQEVYAEEAKPRSKAEIVALLRTEGDRFASYLDGLSDSFLAEPVAMPPGMEPAAKSRFEMLLSAKEHEMHHRGQLMTLERMVGVVPHLTRQRQEQWERMQAGQPQAVRT